MPMSAILGPTALHRRRRPSLTVRARLGTEHGQSSGWLPPQGP
jgi:hypothetical protein